MSVERYKMIAIDFDGTLLSPSGTVSPRTREALRRVLEAGWLVCFATGRNWTESQAILDAVEHYPTAVFAGGAIVIDTDSRLTLHRTTVAPALARELSAFLESHDVAALALQDVTATGVDYLISDSFALNPTAQQWMKMTHASVGTVDSLGKHDHAHTMRLSIISTPERVAVAHAQLQEHFGDRVYSHSVSVPSVGLYVLEIFDPAVNKWAGILTVAARHRIDPADIIAVGDDTNDLPMLRGAGLGVAMGNAGVAVKAVAGRVIGSNTDDGLADFLDELAESRAVAPLGEVDEQAA